MSRAENKWQAESHRGHASEGPDSSLDAEFQDASNVPPFACPTERKSRCIILYQVLAHTLKAIYCLNQTGAIQVNIC